MIVPDVMLVKMPVTILQLVGNLPFYLALNNEFLPYYKQDITVTEELPVCVKAFTTIIMDVLWDV